MRQLHISTFDVPATAVFQLLNAFFFHVFRGTPLFSALNSADPNETFVTALYPLYAPESKATDVLQRFVAMSTLVMLPRYSTDSREGAASMMHHVTKNLPFVDSSETCSFVFLPHDGDYLLYLLVTPLYGDMLPHYHALLELSWVDMED